MTLDERIEAAARSIVPVAVDINPMWIAEQVLHAAFPELFTDPPTHKIVPVVPTEEMITEADKYFDEYDYTDALKRAYSAMLKASP